ncbi:MAG TPA: aminotransferase class I/II-fold pyridoxal phosphate-dependent enzyme, partial [Planctomycetota bacterium]|nr:aminotransferase class I/II-fold pyridoxal phosphate-dependent enzyme [Planctomycetota bacterium]
MSRLAVDGGPPVRATLLPYGRQTVDEDDIQVVLDVLRSDFLTTGPRVAAFERAFERRTGAAHAVAVSNGTAALHAAVALLDLAPGDEVVTTPLTFAATANAVLYAGGVPRFADVDPATLNLDPRAVEARLGPRTRAVIAVDYAGLPADLDELRGICSRRG